MSAVREGPRKILIALAKYLELTNSNSNQKTQKFWNKIPRILTIIITSFVKVNRKSLSRRL